MAINLSWPAEEQEKACAIKTVFFTKIVSTSIPDLHFDCFAIDVNFFSRKFNTDRRSTFQREFIASETRQKIRFANTRITGQDYFEDVISGRWFSHILLSNGLRLILKLNMSLWCVCESIDGSAGELSRKTSDRYILCMIKQPRENTHLYVWVYMSRSLFGLIESDENTEEEERRREKSNA